MTIHWRNNTNFRETTQTR